MTDSETGPDTVHADIGVVHATSLELAPFIARCDRVRKYLGGRMTFRGGFLRDTRVAFVQCGMGEAPARQGTRALLDGHSPPWIISAGFSGALRPELKVGDIVVGNSLVGESGRQLQIDLKMAADPKTGLHVGRLLSTDRLIRAVAEKRSLGERHDALAVDLESLAVAETCRESKVRCLAIRVISDDLSADLPPEVLSLVGDTGSVRLGAALGALWKRPGSAKEMWRLRQNATAAAERLAGFLEGIIEQLHHA